jgi:large subunit ribosomal protein L22
MTDQDDKDAELTSDSDPAAAGGGETGGEQQTPRAGSEPEAGSSTGDSPAADEPEAAEGARQAPEPEAVAADEEPEAAPKPRRTRRKAAAPAAEEAQEPEAEAADHEAQAEAEVKTEPEADEAEEVAPKPARRRRTAKAAEDKPETPKAGKAEKPEKPARGAGRAKPTPSRRRARREPGLPIPVVRAQARYVRSSARKARLVCDHIRGKSVEEARAILALTPRAIARDWSKLLESAVANAEHNHELVGEDLYVKAVHADEGPTIKRFRPRAMGRATKIRKRTSHLTILLTPKD